MKKFWIFILIFSLLITLFSLFIFYIYPLWGRRLVYPIDNKITNYPGVGRITKPFSETYFLNPRLIGRPFFVAVNDISNYLESDYEITKIPAQQQLLYTVGRFEKWEDIPDTLDKYIVVTNPVTKKLEKYRVAFEESDLFKDNSTNFAIEDVSYKYKNITENKIFNIQIEPIIGKNDVVILVPVFDPPELNKMDELGNYLASWVIIRRVGGKL